MGLLADYRRKRQERRHKREDAQAEALWHTQTGSQS
jgi:hypothetical protein